MFQVLSNQPKEDLKGTQWSAARRISNMDLTNGNHFGAYFYSRDSPISFSVIFFFPCPQPTTPNRPNRFAPQTLSYSRADTKFSSRFTLLLDSAAKGVSHLLGFLCKPLSPRKRTALVRGSSSNFSLPSSLNSLNSSQSSIGLFLFPRCHGCEKEGQRCSTPWL